MLICTPSSVCSWDFRVARGADLVATLTFDFWSEQGTIACDGVAYDVRKHGPGSGKWTLESNGAVAAEANKASVFMRVFDLRVTDHAYAVRARSVATRSFNVLHDGDVIGTIRPAHAFTRRAVIECDRRFGDLGQAFAFWLIVLTWRRAARRRSTSAAPA
ncbi:MAG TPA: hypothetical protein VF624_04040 [Tepidisphaeraceae bacterium]